MVARVLVRNRQLSSGDMPMVIGRSPMLTCRPAGEIRQPFGRRVTFGAAVRRAAGFGAGAEGCAAEAAADHAPARRMAVTTTMD